MSLTPVEIRHVDLGRQPLGYDRTATDELLADVAASFEHVWRERPTCATSSRSSRASSPGRRSSSRRFGTRFSRPSGWPTTCAPRPAARPT